jgi:hypothetical protein
MMSVVVALIPVRGFAQPTAGPSSLATLAGHEVNAGVGGYEYVEPGDLAISISGAKFSGEYTGVVPIDGRRRWFVKANARTSVGQSDYDGWCAPWLITPDSASPNGYALDLGSFSPCTDTGNQEWYVETRGLVGRDFVGRSWAWTPEVGLGMRYLSSGLRQLSGFRTDTYLYIPIGLTARTTVASHALSLNVEFDLLLHGWQNTYESKLGGGQVPATDTAPAFTLDGISDLSFAQHIGGALRFSGKYQINKTVSVEPYYMYWRVDSSEVSTATATFTVSGITAQQQFGAYEPLNTTTEAGVKLAFRF